MATRPASGMNSRRRVRLARMPPLDLALQGGGSHGAFTWGVLDRLLEDDELRFSGVSGTSAGALNAALLATGLAEGGAPGSAASRAAARSRLAGFWRAVSEHGRCFGAAGAAGLPMFGAPGMAAYNLDANPWYALAQQWLRLFSPYQFNPLDVNPLRELVQQHVDLHALQNGPLEIFVTATAVQTGQPRVFTRKDISVDALLASACLPHLFRAVEIDGQPYWDGGYSGNPALWPLIYWTPALDLLLVKINPLVRPDLPDTPAEIADRVSEITFNAGLVSEMRAIAFVRRLLAEGRIDAGRYKGLRVHMIADDTGLAPLHPSSKLNTEWSFLQALFGLGRTAAEGWLRQHRQDIGRRSTLDIEGSFLAPRRG
jgi:NTE family protein